MIMEILIGNRNDYEKYILPFEILIDQYQRQTLMPKLSGFLISGQRYFELKRYLDLNLPFNTTVTPTDGTINLFGLKVYPTGFISDDEIICVTLKSKVTTEDRK